MAGAVPSDDDMRKIVAEADADLQYVLTEAAASLSTMYQICKIHKTRRRFQAIADSRAEARSAARTDFSIPNDTAEGRAQTASVVAAWELAKEYSAKETELKAEAKVLGQRRLLQVHEKQAMLKAVTDVYGKLNEAETPSAEYLAAKAEECEVNEPTACTLDRICSKRDNQVESLQTSIDATGHVRVTKTIQKLTMPSNSESYRRVMKVEAYAWLCMSARFKAKAWLQDIKLEHFTKFVDFILEDKVAGLRVPLSSGGDVVGRPPWQVVLGFEQKLRTEAFKSVVEDGTKLVDALDAVQQDPSLKETYFTTPLALQAVAQPTKYFKGQGKAGKEHPAIPSPPQPNYTWSRPDKGRAKGKGKTFNGLQLLSTTPDGRQICFAYNAQGCNNPKCPRLHICRVAGCFAEHPASQHPQSKKGQAGSSQTNN